MRKSILLIVLLAIALAVVACGGSNQPAAAPPTSAPPAAAPAGGGAGNAENGKALFAQPVLNGNAGCSTCHSLEPGKVLVGPSEAGVATRAATTVQGQSAEQYLRTSILKPNEHIAKGCNASDPNADCPASVMPQDWEQKLKPQEVDDLVAYLLTLK